MLVAVERKPTMAHGSYDGGGQCLLQLFFFFPVQRNTLCCCCFFFSSVLFGSSPFGLWWGWSCWWLSDCAVEVTGRWSCYGGRRWLFSSLCRGVSLCFLFFSVDRYSLLSGGVVAAVERKTNSGSPFSFLLPL